MLIYIIFAPIIIGVILYALPFVTAGRVIAIAAQLGLFVVSVVLFFECRQQEIVEYIGNYESFLGIALRADTLSSGFVMLATFIFLVAAIYSFNEADSRLFWFLLFLWQGLLLGVFLSGDLFNIFVLLEVVTLTVSVVIMFKRDSRSMYDGMFYLMINTVSVQFFLFGVGYLYKIAGVFDMNVVAEVLSEVDRSSLILPFVLIMTSIALKCALVPLYSWLPRTHGTPGAPPSVSAILSGLHVKNGIYLFIRFQSIFADVFAPEFFLAIGIITGILGFVLALSQTDIKLILAYHTVSQIGLIMIGLNAGSEYSYMGALYHIFSHALFKSTLFFCAGMIVKVYGTRDLRKIKGVFREMPIVGATIVMATLGITGAPFFNGSISKYFIASGVNWLVDGSIILISLGTIISFVKVSTILVGRREVAGVSGALEAALETSGVSGVSKVPKVSRPKKNIDYCGRIAAIIPGALCLVGGIFGERAISFLFQVELQMDTAEYIQKSGIFVASLVAGYFIYKYYVKNSVLLMKLKDVDIGFRGLCALMGGFFAALLIVTELLT